MEKLKLRTPDFAAENIRKIAELFPNCVTEARDEQGTINRSLDFDQLRQELSDHIVEGPRERYHLDWPGKRGSMLAANAPIAKTLRPCQEESATFAATKNLFIEGDNLDALKLLRETYLGRIKMVYIDPPYNIGTDRIYKDDFTESRDAYLLKSNQESSSGDRLTLNPESNGRFHSDWLTMIYPRLLLTRHLLTEDGVIFISVDDREVDSLHLICSEIFGEASFLGRIVWKNATDNNPTRIAIEHEYILVFCKNKNTVEAVWKSSVSDIKETLIRKGQELAEQYADEAELTAAYSAWFRDHKNQLWPLDGYKFIDRGGIFAGIRGVHNPGREGYRYAVVHPKTGLACVEPLMGYRFPKATMDRLLSENRIIFGEDHTKLIELKAYAHEYQDKLSSIIDLDGRSGAYDVRSLFPELRTAFDNPKPVKLLKRLIDFVLKSDNDILLDYFAGSCSSAHALMELNASDSKARRFIMIQIPEACDEATDAYRAGFKTISELSKERLRRAGKNISEATSAREIAAAQGVLWQPGESATRLDTGFRVFRVDTSNMKDVYYAPDQSKQGALLAQVDNIKADRTPEDLLFQIMLDWGLDLALPIAQENIAGKTVFFVDENALAACFESDVTEAFVKELANLKPLRVVFRDGSFGDDSAKINAEQIFKLLSPSTEIVSI